MCSFPELEDTAADVALRHGLWDGIRAWEEATAGWLACRFDRLGAAALEEQVRGGGGVG